MNTEYAILTVEESHITRYAIPLSCAERTGEVMDMASMIEDIEHENVPFDSERTSSRCVGIKILDEQQAIDVCGEHGYDLFKAATTA